MNKAGAIVNGGFIHSYVGRAGIPHYAASKGGIKLLTKTLALEYAAKGIRINSVNPGYIKTPLLDALSPDAIKELQSLHPIGRLGTRRNSKCCSIFIF